MQGLDVGPEAAQGHGERGARGAQRHRRGQGAQRAGAEEAVDGSAGEGQERDQPEELEGIRTLPAHQVDAVDVDRPSVAEQRDEQRQADGGLGRRDPEDE